MLSYQSYMTADTVPLPRYLYLAMTLSQSSTPVHYIDGQRRDVQSVALPSRNSELAYIEVLGNVYLTWEVVLLMLLHHKVYLFPMASKLGMLEA